MAPGPGSARHILLPILKQAASSSSRRHEVRSSYLAIREYFTRPRLQVEPHSSHLARTRSLQPSPRLGALDSSRTFLSHRGARWQSSTPKGHGESSSGKPPDKTQPHSENSPTSGPSASVPPNQSAAHEDVAHHIQNYPRFLRRLAVSLPNPPHIHRPHRDDFLNIANNMWDRIRIRFKWLTIRGFRKWNADDMSAFFSWFIVGQTLWIFIGTTGFVSVIFAIANNLQMQETLARFISDYLTTETGIHIVFESAIVPKWRDSRICFENVYVSRRPGNTKPLPMHPSAGYKEAARLLSIGEHSHDTWQENMHDERETGHRTKSQPVQDPPTDVTYFDVNIDSVAVTLSLWRWWNGRGIITDAEVKGVRGVIDRRHLTEPYPIDLDPASTRHIAQPGDFQLESLKLEDVLVTIYQPNFRPFTASIFTADLSHFRKQWIFYDLLSADSMVGQFDNCLFSVHRPQSINRTMIGDSKDATWKRMSRFRIDGVNIDHLQYLTAEDGPIAWITSGKVDAVVDIRFGRDPGEDIDIHALLGEIAANISAAASGSSPDSPDVSGAGRDHGAEGEPSVSEGTAAPLPSMNPPERIPGQRELAKPALTAPSEEDDGSFTWEQSINQVIIDIDLRFRDVKAAVPIFANDLSYARNALIRPIVAFLNANRTLIPIRCRVAKDLKEFNGSWTIWQTGLSDDVSNKTYEALAHHVASANQRRLKTVSLWSLRMTASAISSALKNIVDSHSPPRA